MEEQIRAVDHLARLISDGGRQPFVPMSKRADTDACEQVEIFAAVLIEHAHTLAAHEHDRRASVGLHDVLRFELLDVWCHEAFVLFAADRLTRAPVTIRVPTAAPAALP